MCTCMWQVREVLWEHQALIYGVFDFYASVGSSADIFHISLNAYHAFIEECQLAVPGGGLVIIARSEHTVVVVVVHAIIICFL